MKVSNIKSVYFHAAPKIQQHDYTNNENRTQIKELNNVTPDFNVKTPQRYTKINEYKLENGLTIHSYKLANGHRVTIIPMEDSPTVVKNYVNVGSMNETENIKGISHFLEHMAFNGTNGENGHLNLKAGDSFKKIEELGGWTNASTNYAITDYVNSTQQLNKTDLEKQIKIIAAMTEDLKLSDEMIEKEKFPVCSEINMILDNPETIANDQTTRTLFNIKNSADELVGGSVNNIKNLTRKDILEYYNKYYTPDNMNLVITGDVNPEKTISLVAQNFNSKKIAKGKKFEEKLIPIQKTVRKDFVSDKAKACEIVLGFAGPQNNDIRENILFKLANAYINSYSSGLKENLKKYNAYPESGKDKISTNPTSPQIVYLSMQTTEKNSEEALKTLVSTIYNINGPDELVLNSLKDRMLKAHENAFEYSSYVNNIVGDAILDNRLDGIVNFGQILDTITTEEVQDAIHKYFNIEKAAITLVHPAHNNNVAFQGNKVPLKENKITEYTLDNNYKVGLYKTKNNNIQYNISLNIDKPYNKKAGVIEILDLIYNMGNSSMNEFEYKKYKEQNNIKVSCYASPLNIDIRSNSTYNNHKLILKEAKKLLYNPNITETTLAKAKEQIKDSLSKIQDSAFLEYQNYESKNLPFNFSHKEILENLDKITVNDVKECHQYILNNSRGIITANIPEMHPEIKNTIIKDANSFPKAVANIENLHIYKKPTQPVVLQKANSNSQADIMQIHSFKLDNSIKETVVGNLTNSILSNSSIGLFNTLREKEHLAYSVYSELSKIGDKGSISCNILTTTDNKDINEYSYDNVQKSIKGFNNQIKLIKTGQFTDEDLNTAKLSLKSNLLDTEGTNSKLLSLEEGLNNKYGITYINKLFNEIDKITKDDIIEFASKAFQNPPIYSIVASKDTLNYNQEFFKDLEKTSNI